MSNIMNGDERNGMQRAYKIKFFCLLISPLKYVEKLGEMTRVQQHEQFNKKRPHFRMAGGRVDGRLHNSSAIYARSTSTEICSLVREK